MHIENVIQWFPPPINTLLFSDLHLEKLPAFGLAVSDTDTVPNPSQIRPWCLYKNLFPLALEDWLGPLYKVTPKNTSYHYLCDK